jgi:hypothetical protein
MQHTPCWQQQRPDDSPQGSEQDEQGIADVQQWFNQAGALEPNTATEILPLGPQTPDAYDALQ